MYAVCTYFDTYYYCLSYLITVSFFNQYSSSYCSSCTSAGFKRFCSETIFYTILRKKSNKRLINKKLHWPKNILLAKNRQFYSDLAEILAFISTHGLIILTEFDGDWNEIVDFLLLVYFWASVIFS